MLLILISLLAAAPLAAQSDWSSVQQPAVWLSAFVDQAATERTAFWFDGHWRRMGLGAEPQQLLLRPGIQVTLRPGVRAGAGYAYIATAPYGESPNANPTREHRAWQQLSLASRVADLSITQRLRSEQRWGAAVVGGERGSLRYQQRLRYLARAQRELRGITYGGRNLIGFVANEFFLPIGHSDGEQRRLQNRAQIGLGVPISAVQRVEIGYMNQWNRITPRSTHEFNHTMLLSWYWTARR